MPNLSMEIRTAGIADIEAIRKVAFETWPHAYGNILSKEQLQYMLSMMYDAEVLQHELENGFIFLLAHIHNQPIGFASYSLIDENNAIYKLHKLYVLPDYQKTGAGKALLTAVIKDLNIKQAKKLQLNVNRNNNAVAFYKKAGFSIAEEKDVPIGNGFYMNDYIMQLVMG